jgi:hypothetical protein
MGTRAAPDLTTAGPQAVGKRDRCTVGLHVGGLGHPAKAGCYGTMAEHKQGAFDASYHATRLNCNCTLPTATMSPSLSSTLAVRGRPLTETFLIVGAT